VPKRKKKFISRSRLVSTVLSAVAAVGVAIAAIVVGVIVSEDAAAVVVVVENQDARIPMDLILPSMLTTRSPSLH
jgi:P pilus assembly chaperone PapD